MAASETLIIAILFLAAAALYASVGHAGASAYLAVMGLFNVAPGVMKPTALALNILVAAVATVKFYRAGLFSWSLFWPFAVASIPAAFIGGAMMLPARWYEIVVVLPAPLGPSNPYTLPVGTRSVRSCTAVCSANRLVTLTMLIAYSVMYFRGCRLRGTKIYVERECPFRRH